MPYIPDVEATGLGAMVVAMEEPYHEFWFHFGRFIHGFARAELELILLLYEISGLPKQKAGAIFSGTRAEGARDTINNILGATGQIDKKERLKIPFAQLTTIGTIRNNLVHWGAEADNSGSFEVNNQNRSPLNPKSFNISIDDFTKMSRDLNVIYLLLKSERDAGDIPRGLVEVLKQMTWQYKPPQPSLLRKQRNQDQAG